MCVYIRTEVPPGMLKEHGWVRRGIGMRVWEVMAECGDILSVNIPGRRKVNGSQAKDAGVILKFCLNSNS